MPDDHGDDGRKTGYERRAWSKAEDAMIVDLVERCGTKRWSYIASQLETLGEGIKRTGKQCRTRCDPRPARPAHPLHCHLQPAHTAVAIARRPSQLAQPP